MHKNDTGSPSELFVVEAVFSISGRAGPILVPGIPAGLGEREVRVGARVRLVAPDGGCIDTEIVSFEMVNYRTPSGRDSVSAPIGLSPDVSVEQVPVGTKVLLLPPTSSTK